MNEHNFDKEIKDKLEAVMPPYEESAWTSFAAALDYSQLPWWKKIPLWAWLNALAFILLCTLQFFFWYQQEQRLESLSKQLLLSQVQKSHQRDTVWIIQKYDYQYAALSNAPVGYGLGIPTFFNDRQLAGNLFPKGTQSSGIDLTQMRKPDVKVKPVAIVAGTETPSYQKSDFGLSNQTETTHLKQEENRLPVETPGQDLAEILGTATAQALVPTNDSLVSILPDNLADSLSKQEDAIAKEKNQTVILAENDSLPEETVAVKEKSKKSEKPPFPWQWYMGVEAGALLPILDLGQAYPWLLKGINSEFRPSQRWSLAVSLLHTRSIYDLENINNISDVSLGSIPGIEAAGPDITIIETYTTRLLLPINVKYNFPINRRLRGFLTTGIINDFIFQQKFEFYRQEEDMAFSTVNNRSTAELSFLSGGFGVDYQLPKNLVLSFSGKYWHGLAPVGIENRSINGINIATSLKYRLR